MRSRSRPDPPTLDAAGRFKHSGNGLLVPVGYKAQPLNTVIQAIETGNPSYDNLNGGVNLPRDPDSFAVRWAIKGSGLDDLASRSIVDGNIANIGLAPVISSQITGMVKRQQAQAVTASVDITAKRTPLRNARDAIARFNDSPMGVTDALETMVYRLCTYNRGSPIATVPLIYPVAEWESYGMHLRPLRVEGEMQTSPTRFYLEVDWARIGTPIPYLPDPFRLEPTGDQAFPYWYRAQLDDQWLWVLLHHTHIIPMLPGKSEMPGVGTSAVWTCLDVLAEDIMVIEERTEKLLYRFTDGILLLGGIEGADGETIAKKLRNNRREGMAHGYQVARDQTIITSPSGEKMSAVQVNFREPNGTQFKEWREYKEDIIAFAFGEPLSSMVIRGGVGYGSQADAASDNTADSGVGALLSKIALALGAIYPRTSIVINRPNDRAARLNIAALKGVAEATAPLVASGILTPEEVKTIIDRDVMQLPAPDEDTTSATADDNEDDVDTTQDSDHVEAQALAASLKHASAFDVIHRSADVEITDEDVDAAIRLARQRVDPLLAGLLTATPVEE